MKTAQQAYTAYIKSKHHTLPRNVQINHCPDCNGTGKQITAGKKHTCYTCGGEKDEVTK
jgi:DnaJ-class molecular chaperone